MDFSRVFCGACAAHLQADASAPMSQNFESIWQRIYFSFRCSWFHCSTVSINRARAKNVSPPHPPPKKKTAKSNIFDCGSLSVKNAHQKLSQNEMLRQLVSHILKVCLTQPLSATSIIFLSRQQRCSDSLLHTLQSCQTCDHFDQH